MSGTSVKQTRGSNGVMAVMDLLPLHLKKYIVTQDYSKYTALDHAVWRYVLRQLKHFLKSHAHESYLNGLEKTGLDIESVPRIEDVSAHLEKFGWRAMPVSGFIPPAAFMELQSLSVLPIASDMRSIDHLMYTPAPDIVHEAAGHAPFLVDPEYSDYLKQYAQIAKKAIISKEDFNLYEAIRELSDVKENPNSTAEEISEAGQKLNRVSAALSFVSEATQLSRMNWWTAEYGLIGDLDDPKIYGAGLLSSVGESQWCLSDKVKKIPLSLNCINQSYDITEPQPQLFVAKNFKHLTKVLHELSETMAYKTGGVEGLQKAVRAESVNTVEFENKLQISGVLKKYSSENGKATYLQFAGPTQLSYDGTQIKGHDKNYHAEGYGTPAGAIKNFDLKNLKIGEQTTLQYESGCTVKGNLKNILKLSDDAVILSFENATCEYKGEVLFKPEWGIYDIVLAQNVTSVFGGPADRGAYGAVDDFVASRVPAPKYSEKQLQLFKDYQTVRDLRTSSTRSKQAVENLYREFLKTVPDEWLLYLELLEISIKENFESSLIQNLENHLNQIAERKPNIVTHIKAGLKLAHEKF
jgi:phenylalanine-4-hydroxylase